MCPNLEAVCLTNRVDLNGVEYYLYLGYLSASDILKIARVPSFGDSKSNVDIASGIPPHKDPVEDWLLLSKRAAALPTRPLEIEECHRHCS